MITIKEIDELQKALNEFNNDFLQLQKAIKISQITFYYDGHIATDASSPAGLFIIVKQETIKFFYKKCFKSLDKLDELNVNTIEERQKINMAII